ncbi:hypothetical protein BC629DRAFT_1435329 [Irpex lacteus]|nr:hypothetical protein BC629DRAFT_1435329 [Irpex lacteus]
MPRHCGIHVSYRTANVEKHGLGVSIRESCQTVTGVMAARRKLAPSLEDQHSHATKLSAHHVAVTLLTAKLRGHSPAIVQLDFAETVSCPTADHAYFVRHKYTKLSPNWQTAFRSSSSSGAAMRYPERQTSSPLSYPEESQNRLELQLGMIMKLGNRTDLEECFQRRTEIKRQSNYPMVVVVGVSQCAFSLEGSLPWFRPPRALRREKLGRFRIMPTEQDAQDVLLMSFFPHTRVHRVNPFASYMRRGIISSRLHLTGNLYLHGHQCYAVSTNLPKIIPHMQEKGHLCLLPAQTDLPQARGHTQAPRGSG